MSHNVKIFFILVALLLPLSSRSQSYLVRHLGGEVNSKGSESAPLVMGDSLLLYASHDYQHGALMRLCLARMDSLIFLPLLSVSPMPYPAASSTSAMPPTTLSMTSSSLPVALPMTMTR